jgi:hypothetical protein
MDKPTTITATLPEGWHEVPLLPFCRLMAATDLSARVTAFAALVQADAELLLSDIRTYATIRHELPWLEELPALGDGPALSLVHEGQTYEHVGHLEKLTAGQFEALLATLQAHEAAPLLAGPALLALLYRPQGLPVAEWGAATVAATATAFESLPVSVAWPALAFFLSSGLPILQLSLHCSQAQAALQNLTSTVRANLLPQPGGSPGPLSKLRRAAIHLWLRSVEKTL